MTSLFSLLSTNFLIAIQNDFCHEVGAHNFKVGMGDLYQFHIFSRFHTFYCTHPIVLTSMIRHITFSTYYLSPIDAKIYGLGLFNRNRPSTNLSKQLLSWHKKSCPICCPTSCKRSANAHCTHNFHMLS